MQTLGQKIKAIRLGRGETLEQFGEKVGYHKSNVSRWERDVNRPVDAQLKKIAELGNTTVEELLEGKSSKARLEKLEEYINLRLFHVVPTGDFSAGYIKALKDIKNHLREEEQ